MDFLFGDWIQPEPENYWNGGFSAVSIDSKKLKVAVDSYPDYEELTPSKAVEFVENHSDEFFEDNPEDIISILKELFPELEEAA